MMKNVLFEKMVSQEQLDFLPIEWEIPDIEKYSTTRTLFDYQRKALQNAVKGLYKYYEELENYSVDEDLETNDRRKSKLYHIYKDMYDGNIDTKTCHKKSTSRLGKTDETFEIYERHFDVINDTISFEEFTNRMNFWMATASGKSLIIIKLIQILDILMDRGEIPKLNIMLLAPRNDLLKQLKDETKDFNLFPGHNKKIRFESLKNFKGEFANAEQISINYPDEITVYYYRSDNFTDRDSDTEAMLSYASKVNDGRWYVILDEAHRGDSDDSKMKAYYSAFAKNGFLFNFSATFTDEIDKITTIYNFNLEKFLKAGYGKKIYVSQSEFDDFREKVQDDWTEREKKKIVLKGLITLAYLKKCHESLPNKESVYHSPMMLTLVNTVNKSKTSNDPDLLLYFKEVMNIAQNGCDDELLIEARMELIKELSNGQYMYNMGDVNVDTSLISEIDLTDIYNNIYNAEGQGEIEISYSKSNENEVAFFLKSSENISPFCIVRIGDAKRWVRNNLSHLTIVERYEDKKYFENIDKYKDVNILMGSRSFYEGWDSVRPNIINYINIGTQAQAKKYVLQSMGRGIRVQPVKGERQRINEIEYSNMPDELREIKKAEIKTY